MFTKNKFLTFPPKRQHKKCAEILRHLYDLLLTHQPLPPLEPTLSHYNTIQSWLDLPPLPQPTPEAISDRFHFHLNLSGIGVKEHNLLPRTLPRIQEGDRAIASPPLGVAIYLDRLRSAHNIGSILRTTEAFALGEIYFSTQMAYTDNKQVQKASMETYKWISTHQDSHIDTITLPNPIIALETCDNAIALHEFLFPPPPFTLALGNEETGCSTNLLEKADYFVKIPLCGRKNSLNVANAYAIAAAEIRRQHPKGN